MPFLLHTTHLLVGPDFFSVGGNKFRKCCPQSRDMSDALWWANARGGSAVATGRTSSFKRLRMTCSLNHSWFLHLRISCVTGRRNLSMLDSGNAERVSYTTSVSFSSNAALDSLFLLRQPQECLACSQNLYRSTITFIKVIHKSHVGYFFENFCRIFTFPSTSRHSLPKQWRKNARKMYYSLLLFS